MIKHNAVTGLYYEIYTEFKAGKATATPHKPSPSTTIDVGEFIHTDLVGNVTPESLGASSYILTVLDDASGGSWVPF